MEWLQLIPEFANAFVGAGTLVLGVLVYRQQNHKSRDKDHNDETDTDKNDSGTA